MEKLHVKWEVGAENAHGLVGILTVGKWGSENTPEIVLGTMDKRLARHIVALHNRTLD